MRDMDDTEDVSPFAGLDYPVQQKPRWWRRRQPHIIPSTAAIGPLALDLCKVFKVSGKQALAAAVLLDQGRATDALDLLALAEDEK